MQTQGVKSEMWLADPGIQRKEHLKAQAKSTDLCNYKSNFHGLCTIRLLKQSQEICAIANPITKSPSTMRLLTTNEFAIR